MTQKSVIIVEDEAFLALELRDICHDFGYRVLGMAASAGEALGKFAALAPDILITDMELANGTDGIEVAQALRQRHPGIGIIFLTATASAEKLRRIAEMRPDRLLKKPLRISELREAIAAVADKAITK